MSSNISSKRRKNVGQETRSSTSTEQSDHSSPDDDEGIYDLEQDETSRLKTENETIKNSSTNNVPEITDDDSDSPETNEKSMKSTLKSAITDEDRKPKPVSQLTNPVNSIECLNGSKLQIINILLGIILSIILGALYLWWSSPNQSVSPIDIDWRSKVDPNNRLSNEDQNMIRASLKPILDKSSSRQDESLSTLLILSSDEDVAAKIARCLLQLVNKEAAEDKKSIEINLQSDSRNKADLDSYLRTSLNSSDPARAVLLRAINNIPSEHLLQRLRLLFGYCDGENPVIPDRLIILTASSTTENNLRETFKNNLPTEHDFVDALMSRISGHTIYIKNDQESIC